MADRPLCRYCGKPIAKRTRTVRFVDRLAHHMTDDAYTRYVVGTPQTKAEAQRLVNEEIVSVKRGQNQRGENRRLEYIVQGSTWDGSSYVDPFFCNGSHAKDFAYVIARDKPTLGTDSWVTALNEQKGTTR